ncbi:uncharacterized protein BJ212DRAFT_1395562, partial [Suillus subaureus]
MPSISAYAYDAPTHPLHLRRRRGAQHPTSRHYWNAVFMLHLNSVHYQPIHLARAAPFQMFPFLSASLCSHMHQQLASFLIMQDVVLHSSV